MKEEMIVLVDENDKEIGHEEKIKTHRMGRLHRAFSIFVFNSKGELLLQKRAKSKYHSGGLWTNTCCSHQRAGESLEEAAHRRLKEEMGFDCDLKEAFAFVYKTEFDNGLTENEYDHVFIGYFDGRPKKNPKEFEEWKWVSLKELESEMKKNPGRYTYWLKVSFNRLLSHMKNEAKR